MNRIASREGEWARDLTALCNEYLAVVRVIAGRIGDDDMAAPVDNDPRAVIRSREGQRSGVNGDSRREGLGQIG
jgi:hypothetical protein